MHDLRVLINILQMAINSEEDRCVGVLRETRDDPPSDYLFKIMSFSLFSECGFEKIVSGEFVAGGHKWKIVLYPNGQGEGYEDYVSMYLSFADTSSLADGKFFHALFRFFLFDQIRGNYLTVQGKVRRFDSVKYEWGLSKFISLLEFKDPNNGFLVDDTCFLGAEVYVVRSAGVRECLSISNLENVTNKFSWEISQFSESGDECYSDEFDVGSYTWRLYLCPKGDSNNRGCSLSLYLVLMDPPSNSPPEDVKAEFTLTLYDQISVRHHIREGTTWFGPSAWNWSGWDSFIQLKDLEDHTMGFIVGDYCEFEAQVTLLCKTHLNPLDS